VTQATQPVARFTQNNKNVMTQIVFQFGSINLRPGLILWFD